jgi:hypothetical protein
VYISDLQIQKTMMINPSWTCQEAFTKIVEKMFKHFMQEQRESMSIAYTPNTHSLFITPKYKEATSEGLWVKEDEVLEDFDALNQVNKKYVLGSNWEGRGSDT